MMYFTFHNNIERNLSAVYSLLLAVIKLMVHFIIICVKNQENMVYGMTLI